MLKRRKRNIRFGLIILLFIPLIGFIAWCMQETKPLSVLVIDKTVPNTNFQEHRTFMMILKNQNWTKPDGSFYKTDQDYFGFFPQQKPTVIVNDLEQYDTTTIAEMADTLQLLYLADTYGVYSNEWYENKSINERSKLVYGGSTVKEAFMVNKMQERNKLVLGEFNIFASPTGGLVRKKMQEAFGVSWTGWTGRYFENLSDDNNEDLPRWVINLYLKKHETTEWPFTRGGMVFVHENEDIVILDEKRGMAEEVWPIIYSLPTAEKKYKLPASMAYPFWFDIVKPMKGTEVLSQYQLFVSDTGAYELRKAGIPTTFPALVKNNKTYYMAGDFVDNNLPNGLWMYVRWMYEYYNFLPINTPGSIKTRKAFFRHYYYPFIKNVIEKEVLKTND